ncbi:MAG: tetratricopeptide repeat protein [Flavobacteriales bacterium]|nr:tetratricopeptide repeat protein [Flavobacteriales bacterium]MBK7942925.1 tetratricopeptide repeat protein [Flavobacteriales bacterium]MBK9698675.1 tetratricopeptide repeat protein [Flavobacteriales bacterium]
MKALDDLIWENHMDGQPDSAIALAQDLLTFSKTCTNLSWRATVMNTMGSAFTQGSRGVLALGYFAEAARLRNELRDFKGVASSLNNMCSVSKDLGNYATAIELGEHSLRLYRSLTDSTGISAVLSNLGVALQLNGEYESAIERYFEALRIAELLHIDALIANALLNISMVQSDQGNAQAVIAASERVLPMFQRAGDLRSVAGVLGNLGKAHMQLGYGSLAEPLFRRSYAIFDSLSWTTGIALSLNNLAELARKAGRLEQAASDLRRSEALLGEIGDIQLRSSALTNLSWTYLEMGDIHRALESAKLALELADGAGSVTDQRNAHQVMQEAHERNGSWKEALTEHRAYVALRDSILDQKNQNALVRSETEHQYRLRLLTDSLAHMRTVAVKEEAIKRQRQNMTWVISGGSFILVGTFLVYYLDRRHRRARFDRDAAIMKNNLLRTQLDPHFITNALQSINAFVVGNDRVAASKYLVKFAELMRTVLNNSRNEWVGLQNDMDTLKKYAELEEMGAGGRFTCEFRVAAELEGARLNVPPFLAQPFVENAIRHAFPPDGPTGHLEVAITERDKHLVWTITDDGAGMPTELTDVDGGESGGAHGTSITADRLKLLVVKEGERADFRYLPVQRGTCVELVLPMRLLALAAQGQGFATMN